MKTDITQIEKIILQMFLHPEKEWWVAQDFMPPALPKDHYLHVGYEATARISDMVAKYNKEDQIPVFEITKIEKFRAVKFVWENFEHSLKEFPELIELAENTNILKQFGSLVDRVQDYKPVPVVKKQKFKSYAG